VVAPELKPVNEKFPELRLCADGFVCPHNLPATRIKIAQIRVPNANWLKLLIWELL
jgi:hypothetical protein